ncbi:hypothetical protein C9I92_02405 [Photobacterium ganghwense]|uniref:Uncharacterized protein n=1 Tax=Photobacterium ganghwense TaxID=320778 RepID=A0A0J1HGU9_9GAMM|nr:hypothetical protein ABT57_05200 [Photobacterium ganghwense]PSU10982.1 hypothetical protein C9I92_02405 [Photobacterium ganghwense]
MLLALAALRKRLFIQNDVQLLRINLYANTLPSDDFYWQFQFSCLQREYCQGYQALLTDKCLIESTSHSMKAIKRDAGDRTASDEQGREL